MNKEQYLEQHHYITESMIGLISLQDNIEGVKEVLEVWRPKLKEILKLRTISLCEGLSDEDINKVLDCMNLGEI